jgi:hypothetical protein
MIVVVHVHTHYDWEPVPPDVTVTEADIAARKVKPGVGGAWLMRITRKNATHTTVQIPESEIVSFIVAEMVRDKRVITRKEAAAGYLARHTMPHHAHPKWFTRIEVHGDQPDAALLHAEVARHVAAGNIEAESVEDMVAAYLEPVDDATHVAHMRKHFGIKEAS